MNWSGAKQHVASIGSEVRECHTQMLQKPDTLAVRSHQMHRASSLPTIFNRIFCQFCIIFKKCSLKIGHLWFCYGNMNVIVTQRIKMNYHWSLDICHYFKCDLRDQNYSSNPWWKTMAGYFTIINIDCR